MKRYPSEWVGFSLGGHIVEGCGIIKRFQRPWKRVYVRLQLWPVSPDAPALLFMMRGLKPLTKAARDFLAIAEAT